MKTLLLTLILIGGIAASSFAQSAQGVNKFSIGVDAGLPVGDAHDFYKLGIGGSLKYDMSVAKQAAVTLSAGYTALLIKSEFKEEGQKSSYGYIPIKAGFKYFFADNFYGEAQVGAVFSTQSGGGTAFAYAPGIGYNFGGDLDLGIRYEGWSHDGTISQVAARLALSF